MKIHSNIATFSPGDIYGMLVKTNFNENGYHGSFIQNSSHINMFSVTFVKEIEVGAEAVGEVVALELLLVLATVVMTKLGKFKALILVQYLHSFI